ncbi:hypothetical protein FOL47_009023 [Perkinsus chesapeaki]|uniref:Reverse transcriptase domain-containing protein n=1 Tax=Perkinsus chesapeaki TaxID=330153 RepID=A0A7J6LAT7_PERCH|nr:hypothetical protein FOL47_009023 [Perkinsus chesapeaki]
MVRNKCHEPGKESAPKLGIRARRRGKRGRKQRTSHQSSRGLPPKSEPPNESEHHRDGLVKVGTVLVKKLELLSGYRQDSSDVHYYRSGKQYRTSSAEEYVIPESCTPVEHMAHSRSMNYRDSGKTDLPTTLSVPIKAAATKGEQLNGRRQDVISQLEEIAATLEPLKKDWAKRLPGSCRELNLPLLYYLGKITDYPDVGMVEELRDNGGLSFNGDIHAPGIFPLLNNPVKDGTRQRFNEELERQSIKRLSRMRDEVQEITADDEDLWTQAMADVAKGRLIGPVGLAEVGTWEGFGLTERHIVEQPGKRRPCDNYRSSRVNQTMFVQHKVKLPELDTLFASVNELWEASPHPVGLAVWKRDHEDACRQVPLRADQRRYSTIVLRDTSDGKRKAFVHTVFPFGAVSSVTGYLRLSMMLSHIARTLLACPMQSYLDDYYCVESSKTSQSSFEAFGALNRLVGCRLKIAKDCPPAGGATILGIEVDVSISGKMTCRLGQERRENLMNDVSYAVIHGFPAGAAGRKLAGGISRTLWKRISKNAYPGVDRSCRAESRGCQCSS